MFFVLPTNGPEAAMEESAMDIVGQLMQQDLNYENLVQRFHGLALKRRKEVAKRHGSFIDWLISTNEMSSKRSLDFTSAIHKVIGDKLRSQMKSVKPLFVSNVVRDLIKEPGFISEDELKRLFKKHPDFEIVSGIFDRVKVVKEKMPTKANPLLDCSCEELMKIPFDYVMNGGNLQALRSWFKQVSKGRPKLIEQILLSHGCFLRYLVMSSKDASPDDVVEKFSSVVQSKLNSYVASKIAEDGSPMTFEQLQKSFETKFLDSNFLLESLKTNSSKFGVDGGFVTLLRPNQPKDNNLSRAQQGLLDPANDNSQTLDSLSLSVSKILSSNQSAKTRCEKLGKVFRALPSKLKAETLRNKESHWEFIVKRVPNWRQFHKIIHHMVKNILGRETEPLRFLYAHHLILHKYRLMSLTELENSLETSGDFVLERFPPNCIEVCVKRTGANNEPIFYNDCEKRAIVFIMSYFKDGFVRTTFDQLLNIASNSELLSADLHPILFGSHHRAFRNSARKVVTRRSAMFRRFLRMFPTVFTVLGKEVMLNQRAHYEIVSSSAKLRDYEANQNDCSNVEKLTEVPETTCGPSVSNIDCVCCNDDDETDPPKSSESLQKDEERCQNVNASRLNLVGNHKKKRDGRNNNTETSVLSDKLEAISENLIQHVTMGRLLICDDREMSLDTLLESLIDVLIEDEGSRKKSQEDCMLLSGFQSRLKDVLVRMAEKKLLRLDQTGSVCNVKLVLPHSPSPHSPGDLPLAIFRRISCVTRVPNSRMRKYVSSVASLNRKPLSLGILFTFVEHNFASDNVSPKISNDLLQCQVVSCLKSDSKFVLNPVEQTFCFSNDCRKTSPTLKSYQYGVQEKEISSFIVTKLANTDGAFLEALCEKVYSHFAERFGKTPKWAVTYLVQGLLGTIPQVGFTLDGKVALLPDGAESSSSNSCDEDEPIIGTNLHNDCSGSKSSGKDTAVAEPSHDCVERCASRHYTEKKQSRCQSFAENEISLGGCDKPPQDEGHDIGLTSASQSLQSAQVDRADVSTSVVNSGEDELRQSPVKSVSKPSQGLKDNDKSCGNTQMVGDAFNQDQQRATCSASLETNSCAPGILSPEKTSFVSAELSATGRKPDNRSQNARSSTSTDNSPLVLKEEQMDVDTKRETSTQATLPDLSDHASISDKNVSPTISENFLFRKRKFNPPHNEEHETKVFCSGSEL